MKKPGRPARTQPAIDPKSPLSQRCSITLYQADLDVLTKVRDFVRQRGIRNLSDSEGVRLACRTITFDERLLTTYHSMKKEDGRRKS